MRGESNGDSHSIPFVHCGPMAETTDYAYADPLGRVQAYQLALEAARHGRVDARAMLHDPVTRDVGGQLLRALGSIAANIAEGYSRGTVAERRRFFEFALGSARECLVWYETSGHPELKERAARLISIRRLLLTMIRTCRETTARDAKQFQR